LIQLLFCVSFLKGSEVGGLRNRMLWRFDEMRVLVSVVFGILSTRSLDGTFLLFRVWGRGEAWLLVRVEGVVYVYGTVGREDEVPGLRDGHVLSGKLLCPRWRIYLTWNNYAN
jgi:hypothetical protein